MDLERGLLLDQPDDEVAERARLAGQAPVGELDAGVEVPADQHDAAARLEHRLSRRLEIVGGIDHQRRPRRLLAPPCDIDDGGVDALMRHAGRDLSLAFGPGNGRTSDAVPAARKRLCNCRAACSLAYQGTEDSMDTAGRIRAKRDAAAQARRLALGIIDPLDHARMLAFADELSGEADALQRE